MYDPVYKAKVNQKPKQRTNLPSLLGGLVIVLLILQVIVSNRLATTGLKISQIETNIEKLRQGNADLNQQIASASALLTIQDEAKKLGFVKTSKPVYLSQDLPVALDLH